MSKHSVYYFYIIIFSVLILACKLVSKNKAPDNDFTKEQISGKIFWKRIIKEGNYKNYPMWHDHAGIQNGMSPHGRFHRVFINDILLKSVPNKNRIAPYGSICIKENYNSNKELAGITVMVKIKDLNQRDQNKAIRRTLHDEEKELFDSNEWYWIKYDDKGNVQTEGTPLACIKCHAGSNNDFITIRKLDKPLK